MLDALWRSTRRERSTTLAALLALVLTVALVAPARADTLPPTRPLLGVYDGNQGWAMTEVAHLETWQGRTNAVVEMLTRWDDSRKVMDNQAIGSNPTFTSGEQAALRRITDARFTGRA